MRTHELGAGYYASRIDKDKKARGPRTAPSSLTGTAWRTAASRAAGSFIAALTV